MKKGISFSNCFKNSIIAFGSVFQACLDFSFIHNKGDILSWEQLDSKIITIIYTNYTLKVHEECYQISTLCHKRIDQ